MQVGQAQHSRGRGEGETITGHDVRLQRTRAGEGMRKYIIMGVQGSGKGTQAKLLAERLDLEHISVGDLFRWNVQHHTKLGAQVRRGVAAGELVSDDLLETVVHRRLSEHDWNYGFIID